MNNLTKAVMFAAAMLLVGFLGAKDLISEDMATTLFIVLPVIAILSFRGQASCYCFGNLFRKADQP